MILLLFPVSAQIVGDTTVIGTSWYDIQHNGTCGRQIQVDNDGYVHIAWMNSFDEGASQRHIYYQLIDLQANITWTDGVQVDSAVKAGYTTLVIDDEGRAFPAFHQGDPSTCYKTAVGWNNAQGFGLFQAIDLPWVYGYGVDLEVVWPKSAMGIDGRIHLVSLENPFTTEWARLYYGWAEYEESTLNLIVCEEQVEIAKTYGFSHDIASSPVSNRTAVGWMQHPVNGIEVDPYENDLVLCISEDGLTWDWTDTINVTSWIPPDSTLLPDTTYANKDTLRTFTDMCLMFDNDDVLHVFFSTRAYYHFQDSWQTINARGNSLIWHWDEQSDLFSMVANGWFDVDTLLPGAWNKYAQRPSASVDPVTGDIYCMYQRYGEPVDSSSTYPFPYLQGDFTDISAEGWPNGEIWVTKSTDNGLSWSEGINITNTHSPGASAGDCLSELTPSMAPQIIDGNLHIFYVLDGDAGCVVQSEGTWTLNDMIYHKVAITEIPETPLLPPYPMHIDSTGMPPTVSVEPGYTAELPKEFALLKAYPNPFNPTTAISYQLLAVSEVNLAVYDITGREVAVLVDGIQPAGKHSVVFDGSDLTSGVYFARLTAGEFRQSRKILLLK